MNTDPVTSPVKAPKSLDKGEIGDFKKEGSKKSRDRDRARDRPSSVKAIHPPKKQQESIASILSPIESDSPPPETPAPLPLDLFSPLTSEPSAVRPESRDTPPPPDLNPDASNGDAFNAAGRNSRRARGSVSYAEPNLRDKMRRPTKDLVDAVGADERVQRAASAKPEGSKSESEDANGIEPNKVIRTVVIKKEDARSDSASWKSLASIETSENQHQQARAEAASPLGNKPPANLPASVITERRRRTSALHRSDDLPHHEEKPPTSGSGTAIAALLAAGANKKSKNQPLPTRDDPEAKTQLNDPSNATHPTSPPDIYDFASTPFTHDPILPAANPGLIPAPTRTSRRQSSALVSSRSATAIPDTADGTEGSLVSRGAGRRRESLGSGAAAVTTALIAAEAEKQECLEREAAKGGVGFGKGGSGRAERAAGRRRSMMV